MTWKVKQYFALVNIVIPAVFNSRMADQAEIHFDCCLDHQNQYRSRLDQPFGC